MADVQKEAIITDAASETGGVGEVENQDFLRLSKSVLRKIDMRLIPLLFITYNLNFMDKTIISSAAVYGLKDDTNLRGTQYSWVSSIFYFGYLFWEYPTSILIQRLPIGKYVAGNTFFWGAVVAFTAACTNFGGLMTVRFFLGVVEATISPAFLYITSTWYTRAELPTRVGIWFAGNSLGGVFSSFIAYGCGHITNSLTSWQWLFIILGVATFLWGFVLLAVLPDSIRSASFLTEEEKDCAELRVAQEGTGKAKPAWNYNQAKEVFLDPKTFFFFGISLLTQIPNSGTQSFGNLVLTGFGFSSINSTLVQLPASFIAFFTILITGRLAGRYENISTYLIMLVVIFPVIGSALIYSSVSMGVKLFGYYLLSIGPGALPLTMSLLGVNYKGSTKKLTITAFLFISYCTGNIAGPQFFIESEEPHYPTAFRAIMICYALVIVLAGGLRLYLVAANKQRDATEGIVDNADIHAEAAYNEDGEEMTDITTKGFRYRM